MRVPPARLPQPTTTCASGRVPAGDAEPPGTAHGATGLSAAGGTIGVAAASRIELDFAALGHMKRAMRPTLSWESPGSTAAWRGQSSAASITAGSCGAAERENDDVRQESATNAAHGAATGALGVTGGSEQQQRCNLYDVMVHNDGGEDAVALAHEVLRQAPVVSCNLYLRPGKPATAPARDQNVNADPRCSCASRAKHQTCT